jgi:hypothetical protein
MHSDDDIKELDMLRTQLHYKQRRFHILQAQAAREGHETPPHIIIEIEDLEREITDIRLIIKTIENENLPQAHFVSLSSADTHYRSRSVAPLEAPEGTMRPDSPFYIERLPADRIALDAIDRNGETITIKGPRQVGKSSLLGRLMNAAVESQKRVVYLDFQQFDGGARADAEVFFQQFCRWVNDELGLVDRLESYWTPGLGHIQRCRRYFERYILKEIDQQLMLAMDEVDSILDCSFRTDFFAMLRVWHNNRATQPIWRKCDMALVTSTEPYQLVENLHQSPFNVGEVIELNDFTRDQVATLNELHGMPLNPTDEHRLVNLLGGHPYLIRRALFQLADQRLTVDELFAQAAADNGPFGEHLRRHLLRLRARPELVTGMRQALHSQTCDEQVFWRLHGAGLVYREDQKVQPRCDLYARYFRERLK